MSNPFLATAEPFNWNNLVQLLTMLIGAWIAWRVEQRTKTAKEERKTLENVASGMNEVKDSVAQVHEATNGMKTALVEATAKAEHSAGKEEERKEERERVDLKESQKIQLPTQ